MSPKASHSPFGAPERPDLRTLRELFSELDPEGVPAQVHLLGALLERLALSSALDGASRETLHRALELCRDLEDQVRYTGDALAALSVGPQGAVPWSPVGDPASGF